jgi:hypothetical protein
MTEEQAGDLADEEEDDADPGLRDPGGPAMNELSDDDVNDPDVQAYAHRRGHRMARHRNPYVHDHGHDQASVFHHSQRADHSEAAAIAAAHAQAQAQAESLDEADSERRDRERIERLLREMMARQRARAKGKSTASSMGRKAEVENGEAQEEKEELMGLIMGSLRREVARADEEGWMFGETATMGSMVGRDEVGVYD